MADYFDGLVGTGINLIEAAGFVANRAFPQSTRNEPGSPMVQPVWNRQLPSQLAVFQSNSTNVVCIAGFASHLALI